MIQIAKTTGFGYTRIIGELRKTSVGTEIIGRTGIVSSLKVPKPVAVRYAWGDEPRSVKKLKRQADTGAAVGARVVVREFSPTTQEVRDLPNLC